MTQQYNPEFESGMQYSDPIFNVNWPLEPTEISKKDKTWKLFVE